MVLFFEKGKPTKKLWYYQLNLERNLGKTNSLNDNDLKDFVKLVKTKDNSKNSWCIDIEKINKDTFDIETQNPNIVDKIDERTPKEIISEIEKLDEQSAKIFQNIVKESNNKSFENGVKALTITKLWKGTKKRCKTLKTLLKSPWSQESASMQLRTSWKTKDEATTLKLP